MKTWWQRLAARILLHAPIKAIAVRAQLATRGIDTTHASARSKAP